ncbi:hypothetical protein CB0940_12133 [Cercospora beticola]|uniref:AA1-like domain-containing protein n=1 Tax=Cercospora beticola TaxID=122368 RepID=A0A2G5GIE0_CERBT|nr:hypothetical protein CB0940_12133 [Cercospora beticola]PIA80041.1 hypothetical protein CB0940_12133 [Cercospora beticola]WPB07630.1 hypothetical protein RHO25_012291 [Cercospora beticola]CAK1356568.1 unnamed protein product [Cercospora beticola]
MRLSAFPFLLFTTLALCQSAPICEYEVCADHLTTVPPNWVTYDSLLAGPITTKEKITITHFYHTSDYSGRWDVEWQCAAGTAEFKPGTKTQTYRHLANGVLPAAVGIKC